MQHDIVLKKLNFDLLTRQVRGLGEQNIGYHVATFRDSIDSDMQHDHVLKKFNFDLSTPYPRVVGRGWLKAKNVLPCCCILSRFMLSTILHKSALY